MPEFREISVGFLSTLNAKHDFQLKTEREIWALGVINLRRSLMKSISEVHIFRCGFKIRILYLSISYIASKFKLTVKVQMETGKPV